MNPNLETYTAKCSMCGATMILEGVDMSPGNEESLKRIIRHLRCVACATHVRRSLIVRNAIHKEVVTLISVGRAQNAETEELRAKARASLETLLKRWLVIVCSHLRIPAFWDEDLLNVIMTNPRNYDNVLKMTHQGLKKIAKMEVDRQKS